MDVKLKPCPNRECSDDGFCLNVDVETEAHLSAIYRYVKVKCHSCGATGPEIVNRKLSGDDRYRGEFATLSEARVEAAALWNRLPRLRSRRSRYLVRNGLRRLRQRMVGLRLAKPIAWATPAFAFSIYDGDDMTDSPPDVEDRG